MTISDPWLRAVSINALLLLLGPDLPWCHGHRRVGAISDLLAAAWFARQDRIGLVMSICIGWAIQVALVVAPLPVIVSWLLGRPMTLALEDPPDLFAVAGNDKTLATRGWC